MKKICSKMSASLLALATIAVGAMAHGDVVIPVTGWVGHNGPAAPTGMTGSTNSPTFSSADNSTVMAAFPSVILGDGDFVKVSFSMSLPGTRAGDSLGVNSLNTQFRVGLFDGASTVVVGDSGMTGFYFDYSNQAAMASWGNVKELVDTSQTSPLASGLVIGTAPSAGDDPNNASLSGASIPNTVFELTLTRSGSNVNIAGSITASSVPYTQAFTITGYAPQAAGFDFSFNRVGFFMGPRVDGNLGTTNANFQGTLNNVNVLTSVPESRFGMLLIALTAGGVTMGWRLRRAARRQGQA